MLVVANHARVREIRVGDFWTFGLLLMMSGLQSRLRTRSRIPPDPYTGPKYC